MRESTRDLFGLMMRQHGVASRAQARRLGVSRAVERRLVDEGALVEPLRGVLVAGGAAPSFAGAAMAASLCPGVAAVSHGSAARLHHLDGFTDHPGIEVVGRHNARIDLAEPIVVHRTRGRLDGNVVRVGPIRVTSVPLTLVLVASADDETRTAAALVDALRRGVAAAALRGIATAWREPGRTGPGVVLDLLNFLERHSAARLRSA